MTNIVASQRVNLVFAWSGALLALACELQQKAFPWLIASHPPAMWAVLAAITATLVCLHFVKLQRWTVAALCFLLGGLFTSISVGLVAWSSSIG